MTIYTTILSDSERWKLSANYDDGKKRYYGVNLRVPKKVDAKSDRNWDNGEYIFCELFTMVETMYANITYVAVTELNESIYKYLQNKPREVVELYQVLQRGRLLGWDKI